MRTAITIGRNGDKWQLISGPEVPADKQRLAFNNIGDNWPKDFTEIRFQQNDGQAKTIDKDKATNIAKQAKEVQAKVKAKQDLVIKQHADAEEARKAEEKAKADAVASARQAEVDAKANAKKAAAAVKIEVPKPAK